MDSNSSTSSMIKKKKKKKRKLNQTTAMPTSVQGIGAMTGGVSAIPTTTIPGGLQNANMAGLELGKKRMRDSNDDLLMVPRLMHELHTFPFILFFFHFLL